MKRKRNFRAKCLAFLLIVVMVLSEQNITTLGETIGSYAQERMAGSSEQQEEGSAKGDEEGQSVPKSISETDGQQEPSQPLEKATEASTSAPAQDSGAALQQDTSASEQENAVSSNSAQSSGQDVDTKQGQNAQKQDEEKEEEKVVSDDNQETKAKQKKAAAKQQTGDDENGENDTEKETKTNETYLEAAERYYGTGNQPTATITITPNDSEKTTIKTGEAVYYRVQYKLYAAATYNYGEQTQTLFDKYKNTEIILHLPEGMVLDKDSSTLRNVTKVEQSTEDDNDWILSLDPSIDAKSDSTGSFVIALKTGDMQSSKPNGTVEIGYIFDFGEPGTDSVPAEIQTEFTIMDKTGSVPVESDKKYEKKVPTESVLSDLETETSDNWGIKKTAGEPEISDDKTTVTVKYTLEIGLTDAEGNIISNPASYEADGRTPFINNNKTITLKETPEVTDREGKLIEETRITVTPRFGEKTPVTFEKAGTVQSIPVDTCSSYTGDNGETLSKVAASAPYYSVYDVAVVYPYDKFIANYYDENQQKLVVNNEAEITWQLAGQGEPNTSSSNATVEVGETTTPAKLTLTKSIFRYNALSGDSAVSYNSQNREDNAPVEGAVSFEILNENNNEATLYTCNNGTYTKLNTNVVSYNPAAGQDSVTVYMDPGTYTVKEKDIPSNTAKVTASEKEQYNADDKTVAATAAGQTVTFYNRELLGKITVIKKGQKTGEATHTQPLSGATFGLYKDETCMEPIAQDVTDGDGEISFDRLPYGTYYVKEIEAPQGYIKDNEVHEVTISGNNVSDRVESTNKYNLAPAELQKLLYDVKDKAYEEVNQTNYTLFNNRFSIQKWDSQNETWVPMEDAKYNDQSLGTSGTLQRNLPVYEDDGTTLCQYRFVEKLPTGWYAAEAGENSVEITVETLDDGTKLACTEGFTLKEYLGNPDTEPYKVSMGNSRNGSISLTKNFYQAGSTGMTITTDENLSATFKLYYKDGDSGELTPYNNNETYSVKAGGTVNIIDLPLTSDAGVSREYYLVEITKPEGYESSEKDVVGLDGNNAANKTEMMIDSNLTEVYGPFNFTEPVDEEVILEQTAIINNVKQEVPVLVKKVDSYTNLFVPGTKYTIKNDTTNEAVIFEQEIPEGGSAIALAPGQTYTVEETDYPSNYTYNSTTIKMPDGVEKSIAQINLISFGKVDIDTKPIEVTIKNEPDPKFKVTKKLNDATSTDKTLSGVTFEVYKKESDGTFTRVNGYEGEPLTYTAGTELQIPKGTYYLKETNAADNGALDPSTYPNLYTDQGVNSAQEFFFGPYEVKQQKDVNTFKDIVNYSDKGAVTVTKYGMTETGASPLAGAKLGIYKQGEENPVKTGDSAKTTGKVTFSDLPIYDNSGKPIKYVIKEISAPKGYTKSDEELKVTLEPGETVTTDIEGKKLELINQPVTSLEVQKTYYNVWEHAFTGREYYLPGTVIALYKKSADGLKYTFEEVKTTNDMGLVTFENLTQKDEYVAVEVAVPEGEDFQYLEPLDGKKTYLGYAENGNPPDEILANKIGQYAYVKKEANTDENNPKGAQTGELVNVENWAQLHIEKYVLHDASEGDTEDNRNPIDNAQFTLYMEVLDENTPANAELAFEQDNLNKYSVVGSYSSGTLYDEDGTRKKGWFGTDILKAADNVVYWLVETNAGIGAEIRGNNVVTLIKRKSTGYSNKTTYTVGETTYHPDEVMDYEDNKVTKEYFQNDPVTGTGPAMFSTVRISKWAGERTEDGKKEYDQYSSLGNATFDLYLADSTGKLYTKLDTITTGLDNDLGTSQQNLTGWASSKSFSWADIEAYIDELNVSAEVKTSDISQKDTKGNIYVRVAIQESSAPTGYQMDKGTYYMYMFFENSDTTTQIYNDAYYVKGNGASGAGDADTSLAEEQDGITWALYPTTEADDGSYRKYENASIEGSVSNQYRLVNWPIDTQAVTVRTYGYEVQTSNLNKTSEELDEFYASGAYTDREKLDVTMRLERYEEENGVGTWTTYAYASGHSDGIFATSDGYFAFPNGLKMGQYRIIETSVPGNYENVYDESGTGSTDYKDKKAYYFQVSGDNVQISLYNPEKLSLTLMKTDVETSEQDSTPVRDVQFLLTNQNSDKLTQTTSVDGKATFTNIGTGIYKLSESISDANINYSTEYFSKYFNAVYSDEKYNNNNGKGGTLNNLVNGNGIFLGYDTELKNGKDGTSVIVTKKTDITNYGIEPEEGIDLHIENPEKVSFTIAKRDEDHTNTLLGGAEFKVEYIPFSAVNGDITIPADDSGWRTVDRVTTASDGDGKGKVTVSGDPGIYRITETKAPSEYDITDSTPKYIAMTGGLQIDTVIVTNGNEQINVSKDTSDDIVFDDDKQVKLFITKTIDKGNMAVTGTHLFTFSLYEQNADGTIEEEPFKTLSLPSTNGNDVTGDFSDLSQGKTYYLKETEIKDGFAFKEIKDSDGNVMTADGNDYYAITMPDTDTDVSITVVNTYMYGEASIRKVDGEDGTALHDAEFIVKRVTINDNGEEVLTEVPEADFEEEGETGIYRATIPLTGTGEETFRVYEKTAPTDYLRDEELYIKFTLAPGDKQADPIQWDSTKHASGGSVDENNKAMVADRIFPNYCGAYIDLTKYDDIHAVKDSSARAQSNVGFTLYSFDDTDQRWKEETTGTTNANGEIHFVVDGGKMYAIKETTVPTGYQGLDGIYTVSETPDLNDQAVSVAAEDSSLYLINNGNPISAGVTYEYKAYNIPTLSLEIQKRNVLDKSQALRATAALYEVGDGQLTESSTEEEVKAFLAKNNTPVKSGITINTEKTENGETYTYATLENVLVAGKTYLVLETGAGVSQIRDHKDVKWYDIFTVPENAPKGYKETAVLKNVVGDADLNLTKTAATTQYTSLFTEQAEVEYTITPTVKDNTYPLDDFTVTDDGLTAKHKTTALDYNTYLKDKYSLYKVTVGKATHDIAKYAKNTVSGDIYATVTFYDSEGTVIHTSDSLNVTTGEQIAELPVTVTEKAAKISIDYVASDFQTETGYALGANFTPGSITIAATIDKQQGGETKQAIDSIENSSTATLHYTAWKGDGTKAEEPTEVKKTAEATITFAEKKAAKISVSKAVEGGTKVVNLGDVVTYNVTVSNAATAEASMENPYIVDYLPQGTSLVEFDDDHVVNLQEGDTNLVYDQSGSSIGTQNGEKAVIIALNGELKPGESVTVQLKLKIEDTVTAYGKAIKNYVLVGSAVPGVVTDENKQGASFKNANDAWAQKLDTILGNEVSIERLADLKTILASRSTDGFISASASINWATATDMALVKSAYGDGNEKDGYTTDILSVVQNGGTMHYKLSISNISEENGATDFSVIDILPNIADITSSNVVRESQWKLDFGQIEAIYVSDENGSTTSIRENQYKEYYYTGQLSDSDAYQALYDQVDEIKFTTTPLPNGWTDQVPTNKKDVKAFIVATDDTVKLVGNSSLVIEYTATVNGGEEWDDTTLNNNSWTNAVNSFSCDCVQYDKEDPNTTWDTGVLGSNQVSTTIMPAQVKVGGHIWIDKNNNGFWDEGESINNFAQNTLIQDMLEKVTINLSTYRGKSALSEDTPYSKTGSWKNTAEFVFDQLNPAMLKENVSQNVAYPNNELDPGQLKGTEPYTYTLKVDLNNAAGNYQFAKVNNELRMSYEPGAIPNAQQEDSNFVKNGNDGQNATSERFYLWATAPNVYDNTKDVGLVPYRDLVITKTTEDSKPISGVEFKVYGPFNSEDINESQLTEDNLVKPDVPEGEEDSTTFTTDDEGKVTIPNLLWYQYYVVVEDSAPEGYKLDIQSAKAIAESTTIFTKDENGVNDKPAWVLGIPADTKTAAVDNVTITNERKAVDATLTASKKYLVQGKEETIPTNTFTIALWKDDPTEEGAQPLVVKTVDTTGKIEFTSADTSELSFTNTDAGKEFYITEQLPNKATQNNNYTVNGVTYDTTIYKAKVKVDWVEGEGLKVSSVNYFKQNGENEWVPIENNTTPTFTNTYSASGSWTPKGTKTLTGRNMKAGETFTFWVKDEKEKIVSTGTATGGTNGQKTDIIFGEIRYDLDDVGIHTYTITEDVPAGAQGNGVTYDSTTYTVEVTVRDEGDGTLEVTPTYKNGNANVSSADFTNSYVPTPIPYPPNVKKILEGQSLPDGKTKEFTFVLSALSDNAKEVLPQDKEIQISFTNNGELNKTTAFDAITFTQGGTYTFKITEKSGVQNDGYTYDSSEWTLTVVVTDNQEGELSIGNATYRSNKQGVQQNTTGAEFTNNYTPTPVNGRLAVSKVVEGAPMAKKETFTFTQTFVSGDEAGVTMPEGDANKVQITVKPDDAADAETNIAQFAAITFTKAGTYYFHITEDTASLPNGYDKYITATKLAKVVVKDVDGQLEIENIKYYTTDASTEGTTSADTGDKAAFTNRYNTKDTVFAPKVTKVFTGDAPTGEKIFTFQMTRGDDKEGVTMPSQNKTSVTYNGNTGTIKDISFDEITFTKAGTYTFKITEQQGEQKDGYTYDVSEWTLTVKVEDNNSQLEVTESKYRRTDGKESTNCAEFTNTYTLTPVDYAPQVQKTIEGAAVPENSIASFAFTLTNIGRTDGVNLAEGVTKDVTICAADIKANQGTKQFDPLNFTKAGTYEFQIAETTGTENGYTYDQKNWKLTITVEDKGGYLEVTKKQYTIMYTAEGEDDGANAEKASFTNTYAVTPVPYTPQVEKTFSADSVARPTAKDFEFVLTADAGNPQNGAFTGGAAGTALAGEHNTLKTTVSGTGTAFFDEITFTKAGTYHFTIEETEGTDLGYTYDDAKWTLTVTVTDVGGQLTATQTYKSSDDAVQGRTDKAVFENTYSYVASIFLNKEVLRGDAAYETNDIFYAGIFTKTTNADGGETTYDRVGDVVTLNNNGSVEVFVPLGGADQTEAITYYVFETDQEGHPLISFGENGEVIYNQPSVYEISISSKDKDGNDSHIGEVYVTPDGATMHPEVTITNRVSNVSIEKTDMDGAPLSGATLELWKTADSVDADETADAERTKDDEGNVLLETWVSDGTPHELIAELAIGGTYYLHEKEAPEGYVMAADIPFTVENGEPITLVMEDMAQTQAMGQIAVTKRLSTIDESTFDFVALVAADETFYVGLFTDPEGKHPYGEDYVKPIRIQGASSNTATFDNLPSGTYYVFETLQDGTIIPYGEVQDNNGNAAGSFACISDSSNGTAKEITLDFAVDKIGVPQN